MQIGESLRGKNVLITGVTGFVGKVLFAKLLKEFPHLGTLFLLVRGNAVERVRRDIWESPLFQQLFTEMDVEMERRVVPLSGDILKEGLGLREEELRRLEKEVNVVFHMAATISVTERLDEAVKINVLGALSLLETARKFERLEAFVHTSSAFVNADRDGFHAEVLPPLHFDPEEMVQLILQMHPNEMEKATPTILGNYPNANTFTKAIAERILEKRRGAVPLCFVRPTIIGCAWREPIPGWVDSVTTVGAMVLFTGVGLVHFMQGDPNLTTDIVPVDVVVNCMIVAAVATMRASGELGIYQVGTSHVNPICWRETGRWISAYWRQHNVKKRVVNDPIRFKFYKTETMYRTQNFLRNELPASLYTAFASTVGSAQHRKNAEILRRMTSKTAKTTRAFRHFTNHEWIFDIGNTEQMMKRVAESERAKFYFDLKSMDWEKYWRFYCYGMQRFVLKEEVRPPTDLLKADLIAEPRRPVDQANTFLTRTFSDLAWAYKNYRSNIGIDNLNTLRTLKETKDLIIKSPRVQAAIMRVHKDENIGVGEIEARSHDILDQMAHTLRMPVLRVLGWFLRKVFRQIYQGIHVDENGLEQVRAVLSKGPLVLIPTHRSYVDFLILSYIFFEYDLPLPHIAAGEDFLGIAFVNWVFRNSGAFFLRRSFKGDVLYTALFTEYVQRLVQDWAPIEFFIEGKRSRTGKSLHPKYGLLSICVDPFLDKKIPDMTIVPISISYEKVIEAELYSNEMLGEKKAKESLQGLVRARRILQMNFGRINVVFNKPLILSEWTELKTAQYSKQSKIYDPFVNPKDRTHFLQELAYKVVHEMNRGLVVTATGLVATLVVTYRKGITLEDLKAKVDWMREEINRRGGSVAYEGTTSSLVEEGLKMLGDHVAQERKLLVPAVSSESEHRNKSILVMDLYRNQLLHLFNIEGVVACAVHSSLLSKSGVRKEDLVRECEFLNSLLSLEFVNLPSPHVKLDFMAVIRSLLERGILRPEEGHTKDSTPTIHISDQGEGFISFLCNMFWPLIDSYWVSGVALFSLQPSLSLKRGLFLQRVQWIAEKMHSEGKIHFYESCSMEVLANTLELWKRWKLIQIREVPSKSSTTTGSRKEAKKRLKKKSTPEDPLVSLLPPYDKESALQDVLQHINQFRRVAPSSNGQTPSTSRQEVIADFPVLAKL